MMNTISTIEESASESARALADMVRRLAPGLMRSGGGALARELPMPARLTPKHRAEIAALRRQGLSYGKIVRASGWSIATVSSVCRSMGMGGLASRRVERLAA